MCISILCVLVRVEYYFSTEFEIENIGKFLYSLGGPQPYVPVGLDDDENSAMLNNIDINSSNYQRARVLCSYDAKDGTELNLTANEV